MKICSEKNGQIITSKALGEEGNEIKHLVGYPQILEELMGELAKLNDHLASTLSFAARTGKPRPNLKLSRTFRALVKNLSTKYHQKAQKFCNA